MAYQEKEGASNDSKILERRRATVAAMNADKGKVAPGATPAPAIDPFASDPYGDIASYENYKFDYPIELMQARGMLPQSYGLQQQNAMQTVQSGAQSGALGGMTSLASTTGLSEADRQAMAAQGQRQRVNLAQGSQAPIKQMQAQNFYDTQQFNTSQGQQAADYNMKLQNDQARDMAVQKENQAMNIYQRRLTEAMLQRQLEKSSEIASKQK